MRLAACLIAVASSVALFGTSVSAQAEPERFHYRDEWRRFGLYDYGGTMAVLGAYFTVELTQRTPRGADWTYTFPFDRPVNDWLAADSRAEREQANVLSDYFWALSVAYPVADSVVTPMVRSLSVDAAWQMSMMNVQAFSAVSLLIRMPHKWVGRLRPDADGCAKDPSYSWHCKGGGLYVSFPGGHVAVSMTGAGLACAHHLHGQLYGSPVADRIACAGALSGALAVGYLRMRAESHWLSDQLVGVGLGLFSGYALPTLLYYRPFWRDQSKPTKRSSREAGPRFAIAPLVSPDALGASFLMSE